MFAKRTIAAISTFVIAILVSSTLSSLPVKAATVGADWYGQEGNYPFNHNYNGQTLLTVSNAAQLSLQWAFPIPSAPPTAIVGSDGVIITPMILNGIAYFLTNWNGVFAVDAHDGKIIWQKTLPYNQSSLNTYPGQAVGANHYHGLWNTVVSRGGTPLLWVASDNYTVYALNALTGDQTLRFNPLTRGQIKHIPGNFGTYKNRVPGIVIDDKRGLLIFSSTGTESSDAGRGWFAAYNINTTPPTFLWRSFIIPPQDGSDQSWSIKSVQNMSYAYTFDGTNQVDLKAMSAAQLKTVLQGDWGNFGYNGTFSFTGANPAWGGSYALDPSTGIAYLATAQPSDDNNATFRPGLNLWSDSVMALDEQTGKFVWAFQTTAHDLGDYDCSWAVMLGNATIGGTVHKTVFKGCKNGYFYALDAATGKMFWAFNPSTLKRVDAGVITNHDPLNQTEMTLRWQTYPSTKPHIQNPPLTGGIESNPAFDQANNIAFVTSYNAPTVVQCSVIGPYKGVPYGGSKPCTGVTPLSKTPTFPNNATLWAIDVNTGKTLWQFNVSTVGFRGGVSVSNGIVFLPTADGYLRLLDEKTGNLLNQILIGAAMITQAAIGLDASGNVRVIVPVSTSSRIGLLTGTGLTTPGYIAALGLPANIQHLTTTAVSIVSATVVSTVTGAGTTTGVDTSTFYAVAGLAAIFIIATGFLAVRRRKPAP